MVSVWLVICELKEEMRKGVRKACDISDIEYIYRFWIYFGYNLNLEAEQIGLLFACIHNTHYSFIRACLQTGQNTKVMALYHQAKHMIICTQQIHVKTITYIVFNFA